MVHPAQMAALAACHDRARRRESPTEPPLTDAPGTAIRAHTLPLLSRSRAAAHGLGASEHQSRPPSPGDRAPNRGILRSYAPLAPPIGKIHLRGPASPSVFLTCGVRRLGMTEHAFCSSGVRQSRGSATCPRRRPVNRADPSDRNRRRPTIVTCGPHSPSKPAGKRTPINTRITRSIVPSFVAKNLAIGHFLSKEKSQKRAKGFTFRMNDSHE